MNFITYVFVNSYNGEEVIIRATSIDEAWKMLEKEGHSSQNFMLESFY